MTAMSTSPPELEEVKVACYFPKTPTQTYQPNNMTYFGSNHTTLNNRYLLISIFIFSLALDFTLTVGRLYRTSRVNRSLEGKMSPGVAYKITLLRFLPGYPDIKLHLIQVNPVCLQGLEVFWKPGRPIWIQWILVEKISL